MFWFGSKKRSITIFIYITYLVVKAAMKVISVNLALAPPTFEIAKKNLKKVLSGKILRQLLFLQNLSLHTEEGDSMFKLLTHLRVSECLV